MFEQGPIGERKKKAKQKSKQEIRQFRECEVLTCDDQKKTT